MEVLKQLEPLMRDIIAPQAAQIDEQARYPRAALDALASRAAYLKILGSYPQAVY